MTDVVRSTSATKDEHSLRVEIENFAGLPDHVRESALAQIEHAHPSILSWAPEPDGVFVQLAEGVTGEHEIAEQVRKLMLESINSYRFFRSETLHENEGAPINTVSPFPELVATGQVSMISPGAPVYQGELARRLTAADERFRDLAWARGAMEQLYPSTVSTQSLAENGYLASYPQHALLTAALHRDAESLNAAAELAKEPPAAYAMSVRPFMGEAAEVLAPTVCYRCFDALRRSPNLARPLSAGRTFTGTANCHRREDKALEELSRLQTFRMREVVFFGSSDFVCEHRDWWIEAFADLLRDWGLKFRIVAASDAFFSATAARKRAYQSMRRLKYECQVQLPHSGQWLAVASFNNHESTLTRAYSLIEGADPAREVNSGCVGFGLDRLVFGVLSQFGCDSGRWPASLREFFGEDEVAETAAWKV